MVAKAGRPSVLKHIHIPTPTSYHTASRLQDTLVRKFLDYKASPETVALPTPTIITFSPNPIYTTGRRELLKPISQAQYVHLTSPLEHASPDGEAQVAEVYQAARGGQLTFHGPGQLVIYPILDLLSVALSPRCYVSLLEAVTISTLKRYGIQGRRTDNPGVWLQRDTDVKIAALGVHLRRNISSHGVGINVSTDLRWFDRIVACGLEGKRVGSMTRELTQTRLQADIKRLHGHDSVAEVGQVWVEEIARELRLDVMSTVYAENSADNT